LSKDYVDDGLMLLYHKFDSPTTTELERECRSLVIDRLTLKIKSYSCETPINNKESMKYLIENSSKPKLIFQCYEGTYLSVFNNNGKWYVSTRRCLDSQESVFNHVEKQTTMSHYEMFDDIIKKAGYNNFNEFSKKLDPVKSYYFILIHHNNKHIIDYTSQFGDNYSRICLTTVRDSEMRELDIYENKVDFASYDDLNYDTTKSLPYIFVPKILESFEKFLNVNKNIKYNELPESEGVVIRVWNETMNKYHLIKLQTVNYQFSQALGTDNNIFKGLIYLYQNNKLVEYFAQNPDNSNIKKIINPLDITESYDTIGTVDAIFKVCSSELLELFKIIWSIKNGQQQNKLLYGLLPKEYRDIMYSIKGIYYSKKALYINKYKESITPDDIKKARLKTSDIYEYIKTLPTETFVAFLRMRKLMFNWCNIESTNYSLVEFKTISSHCDKIHIKLCAIFTNKLYPNIMFTDIPHKDTSIIQTNLNYKK
jgi:hypothetical protein